MWMLGDGGVDIVRWRMGWILCLGTCECWRGWWGPVRREITSLCERESNSGERGFGGGGFPSEGHGYLPNSIPPCQRAWATLLSRGPRHYIICWAYFIMHTHLFSACLSSYPTLWLITILLPLPPRRTRSMLWVADGVSWRAVK